MGYLISPPLLLLTTCNCLNYLKVGMWFNHLKTVQDNRKRGAAKAAQTRKKRGYNKKDSAKVCNSDILISSKTRCDTVNSQ